ncbi:hypothetical protein [Aminomonas paucivorans]|uniref:hypothetical protein n=1 Tax=Aminomonas paucivorans TaxID=81412 RepID=UPI0033189B74
MARQDQAWKNALQALFPHALEFFLPSLEAHRDRTRPFEFLEQELRAVSRGVRRGGVVDALVKVPLPEGEDSWLLLHVEIQGRAASGEIPFPERMFSYAARIWDRYHRRITALAVLTEPDGTRVPDRFVLEAYGTELAYRYNLRPLAREDEGALLASTNPFALAVLAAKKRPDLRTDAQRRQFTLDLLRLMRSRKRPQEERWALCLFLEGVLPLRNPSEQELYWREVEKMEAKEEEPMQQISVAEKIARRRGRQEGKQEGRQEGRLDHQLFLVRRLASRGHTPEEIGDLMDLSPEAVRALLETPPNP